MKPLFPVFFIIYFLGSFQSKGADKTECPGFLVNMKGDTIRCKILLNTKRFVDRIDLQEEFKYINQEGKVKSAYPEDYSSVAFEFDGKWEYWDSRYFRLIMAVGVNTVPRFLHRETLGKISIYRWYMAISSTDSYDQSRPSGNRFSSTTSIHNELVVHKEGIKMKLIGPSGGTKYFDEIFNDCEAFKKKMAENDPNFQNVFLMVKYYNENCP